MLDETPTKKPRPRSAGDTSGGGAAMATADRLSALPDEVLHHVMSFLRAWEVARTCVLLRRWRHLWASAPCVDLRVWRLGHHRRPPERFAKFVYRFLLERHASGPVDTLRVLSSPDRGEDPHHRLLSSPSPSDDEREDYTSDDVETWIHAAIKRRARVIQLTGHPMDEAFSDMDRVRVISCHLEHLKLSVCWFWRKKLSQICSHCPSLQVLDSDSDCSLEDDHDGCSDSCSQASTCEYLTDNEDKQCGDHGQGQDHCKHCKCNDRPHWLRHGYGRRNRFGVDKILGGHNVLHSLSNATSLVLLVDAGEVILNRELKTCPVFSNLKTLSLGEWCMTADFDPLVLYRREPAEPLVFL